MEILLTPDEEKISEAMTFIRSFSSVILGTTTRTGEPHTSYAPYNSGGGNIYIYVSALAQHAESLKNGKVSLFFIENEQQAKSIFARTRLTIDCTADAVVRDSRLYLTQLDHLQARHGSTVKLLRTLPDFTLYELSPRTAAFVTGFGAAYDLSGVLKQLV